MSVFCVIVPFVLLSRVYVMKFEVCQQCFVLLSRVYVMKFEICQE